MGSRLTVDGAGRVWVEVTTPAASLPAGARLLVLGNDFVAGAIGVQWLGRSGRPPTPREQAEARLPYRAPDYRPVVERVDDDVLDDAQALKLCRREQEREPVDVVNVPLAA